MKDDYFTKQLEKINQRIKLLIIKPDFQEDMLALRKKWKVPQNGIKGNDASEKWHRELYRSEEEYFKNVWGIRRKDITKLKKERRFQEAENLTRELNNGMPINAFRIDIKNLLRKYKLPLRWENGIKRYLLFNDPDNMAISIGVTVHFEYDKDSSLPKLFIGIEDDTTINDIKAVWSEIKFHQKRLNSHVKDKFQPIINFDRDRRAYELKQEGKTIDEIEDAIQEEFNESLDYNELNIAIKRYIKRLNTN